MFSDHFPKISEDSSKSALKHTNDSEHFTKIYEDFQRLPKTFEEDSKMFRSYTNKLSIV